MRDTTSSIATHIAGEANQAVLLPNAAIVHNEQTAKSKQNNDFLIVLLYRQLSVYIVSSHLSEMPTLNTHLPTYVSSFMLRSGRK